MRVALVVNRFPILSETFIYTHAAGLQAAGLDVTVIATSPTDDPYIVDDAPMFATLDGQKYTGPVRRMVVSRGVVTTARHAAARLRSGTSRDVALWTEARRRFGFSRRAIRAWLTALTFCDFELIHFEFSGLAVAYQEALALLDGTHVVVSCRGSAERITPLIEPTRAAELRTMFARADRVHCVSQDMMRTCESYGLDPAKAFVNRPAVNAARFSRTRPYVARARGPYRMVSTGRLIWAKGLEHGLGAMRLLIDGGHDVHWTIIGAGPEEERLRFAIHDLKLDDHVVLAGRLAPAQVRVALEEADVFLLPSVSEGISNAALEAMAMEVPVVASRAGGMDEAITDGVHGLLVPPRSPDTIARAVARLLADPVSRVELGRAARRRVETEFSVSRQIDVFLSEYRGLAEALS